MRLPNASFIGFTGTPIATEDKDTRAVFGDYVSIYDIQDAVDDGATVPIYYESRLAKLDINQAEIEALNDEVEEVIEDEEDIARTGEDQEQVGGAGKAGGRRAAHQGSGRGSGAALRRRATPRIEGKAMIVGHEPRHLRPSLQRDHRAAAGGTGTSGRTSDTEEAPSRSS